MNDNIVVASFSDARHETRTRRVYQYDYGMVLTVDGIDLPVAFEAHFSNTDDTGTSTTQIGSDSAVTIPDAYLLTGLPIYCWIYLHSGETDGETVYKITIPVKRRAQPTNETPTPVQQDAITEAIAALNSAVTQTGQDASSAEASASDAADSAEEAKGYKEGAEEAEGNATTSATQAAEHAENAQGYAENAALSASQADASATTASQYAQAAAQSASDADTANTAAQTAKTASQTAQSAAETAQGRSETAQGKSEAAQTKAETAQSKAETAQGKAETAQTAAETAQAGAEGALSDVLAAKTAAQAAQAGAEAAQTAAETAESNAAGSAADAQEAAEECEAMTEAVAKDATAQEILEETKGITDGLDELLDIQRSVRFYPELPETGTDGYVYITPDGVFYYDGTEDEFISCAGGSGSLNGFSFELDEDRKIIVSYVNPEDETDTDSATVPSADTVDEIIAEMQGITSALTKIAEGGE